MDLKLAGPVRVLTFENRGSGSEKMSRVQRTRVAGTSLLTLFVKIVSRRECNDRTVIKCCRFIFQLRGDVYYGSGTTCAYYYLHNFTLNPTKQIILLK